jgi:hypothetical protein
MWLSPRERNESYRFEQSIEFDPTEPVSLDKLRKFQGIFYKETATVKVFRFDP